MQTQRQKLYPKKKNTPWVVEWTNVRSYSSTTKYFNFTRRYRFKWYAKFDTLVTRWLHSLYSGEVYLYKEVEIPQSRVHA